MTGVSHLPTRGAVPGVALGYGLAAVYLRFGVDEACPPWACTLFFAIVGGLFLMINGEHWFNPGVVLTTIEIGAIAALAAGGYALFYLVLQRYDLPAPRERLRNAWWWLHAWWHAE